MIEVLHVFFVIQQVHLKKKVILGHRLILKSKEIISPSYYFLFYFSSLCYRPLEIPASDGTRCCRLIFVAVAMTQVTTWGCRAVISKIVPAVFLSRDDPSSEFCISKFLIKYQTIFVSFHGKNLLKLLLRGKHAHDAC